MESYKQAFHNKQYLKPSNLILASISEHVRKKIVEFTDSAHVPYWPTNIA